MTWTILLVFLLGLTAVGSLHDVQKTVEISHRSGYATVHEEQVTRPVSPRLMTPPPPGPPAQRPDPPPTTTTTPAPVIAAEPTSLSGAVDRNVNPAWRESVCGNCTYDSFFWIPVSGLHNLLEVRSTATALYEGLARTVSTDNVGDCVCIFHGVLCKAPNWNPNQAFYGMLRCASTRGDGVWTDFIKRNIAVKKDWEALLEYAIRPTTEEDAFVLRDLFGFKHVDVGHTYMETIAQVCGQNTIVALNVLTRIGKDLHQIPRSYWLECYYAGARPDMHQLECIVMHNCSHLGKERASYLRMVVDAAHHNYRNTKVCDLDKKYKFGFGTLVCGHGYVRQQIKPDGPQYMEDEVFTPLWKIIAPDRYTVAVSPAIPMQWQNSLSTEFLQLALWFEHCLSIAHVSWGVYADIVVVWNTQGVCQATYGHESGTVSEITLSERCMEANRTFTHEMFHVFGRKHEHNRKDRDDHVEVIWSQIPDRMKPQYRIDNTVTRADEFPYDLDSIMHYPLGPQLRSRDGYMQRRGGATFLDIWATRAMIGCQSLFRCTVCHDYVSYGETVDTVGHSATIETEVVSIRPTLPTPAEPEKLVRVRRRGPMGYVIQNLLEDSENKTFWSGIKDQQCSLFSSTAGNTLPKTLFGSPVRGSTVFVCSTQKAHQCHDSCESCVAYGCKLHSPNCWAGTVSQADSWNMVVLVEHKRQLTAWVKFPTYILVLKEGEQCLRYYSMEHGVLRVGAMAVSYNLTKSCANWVSDVQFDVMKTQMMNGKPVYFVSDYKCVNPQNKTAVAVGEWKQECFQFSSAMRCKGSMMLPEYSIWTGCWQWVMKIAIVIAVSCLNVFAGIGTMLAMLIWGVVGLGQDTHCVPHIPEITGTAQMNGEWLNGSIGFAMITPGQCIRFSAEQGTVAELVLYDVYSDLHLVPVGGIPTTLRSEIRVDYACKGGSTEIGSREIYMIESCEFWKLREEDRWSKGLSDTKIPCFWFGNTKVGFAFVLPCSIKSDEYAYVFERLMVANAPRVHWSFSGLHGQHLSGVHDFAANSQLVIGTKDERVVLDFVRSQEHDVRKLVSYEGEWYHCPGFIDNRIINPRPSPNTSWISEEILEMQWHFAGKTSASVSHRENLFESVQLPYCQSLKENKMSPWFRLNVTGSGFNRTAQGQVSPLYISAAISYSAHERVLNEKLNCVADWRINHIHSSRGTGYTITTVVVEVANVSGNGTVSFQATQCNLMSPSVYAIRQEEFELTMRCGLQTTGLLKVSICGNETETEFTAPMVDWTWDAKFAYHKVAGYLSTGAWDNTVSWLHGAGNSISDGFRTATDWMGGIGTLVSYIWKYALAACLLIAGAALAISGNLIIGGVIGVLGLIDIIWSEVSAEVIPEQVFRATFCQNYEAVILTRGLITLAYLYGMLTFGKMALFQGIVYALEWVYYESLMNGCFWLVAKNCFTAPHLEGLMAWYFISVTVTVLFGYWFNGFWYLKRWSWKLDRFIGSKVNGKFNAWDIVTMSMAGSARARESILWLFGFIGQISTMLTMSIVLVVFTNGLLQGIGVGIIMFAITWWLCKPSRLQTRREMAERRLEGLDEDEWYPEGTSSIWLNAAAGMWQKVSYLKEWQKQGLAGYSRWTYNMAWDGDGWKTTCTHNTTGRKRVYAARHCARTNENYDYGWVKHYRYDSMCSAPMTNYHSRPQIWWSPRGPVDLKWRTTSINDQWEICEVFAKRGDCGSVFSDCFGEPTFVMSGGLLTKGGPKRKGFLTVLLVWDRKHKIIGHGKKFARTYAAAQRARRVVPKEVKQVVQPAPTIDEVRSGHIPPVGMKWKTKNNVRNAKRKAANAAKLLLAEPQSGLDAFKDLLPEEAEDIPTDNPDSAYWVFKEFLTPEGDEKVELPSVWKLFRRVRISKKVKSRRIRPLTDDEKWAASVEGDLDFWRQNTNPSSPPYKKPWSTTSRYTRVTGKLRFRCYRALPRKCTKMLWCIRPAISPSAGCRLALNKKGKLVRVNASPKQHQPSDGAPTSDSVVVGEEGNTLSEMEKLPPAKTGSLEGEKPLDIAPGSEESCNSQMTVRPYGPEDEEMAALAKEYLLEAGMSEADIEDEQAYLLAMDCYEELEFEEEGLQSSNWDENTPFECDDSTVVDWHYEPLEEVIIDEKPALPLPEVDLFKFTPIEIDASSLIFCADAQSNEEKKEEKKEEEKEDVPDPPSFPGEIKPTKKQLTWKSNASKHLWEAMLLTELSVGVNDGGVSNRLTTMHELWKVLNYHGRVILRDAKGAQKKPRSSSAPRGTTAPIAPRKKVQIDSQPQKEAVPPEVPPGALPQRKFSIGSVGNAIKNAAISVATSMPFVASNEAKIKEYGAELIPRPKRTRADPADVVESQIEHAIKMAGAGVLTLDERINMLAQTPLGPSAVAGVFSRWPFQNIVFTRKETPTKAVVDKCIDILKKYQTSTCTPEETRALVGLFYLSQKSPDLAETMASMDAAQYAKLRMKFALANASNTDRRRLIKACLVVAEKEFCENTGKTTAEWLEWLERNRNIGLLKDVEEKKAVQERNASRPPSTSRAPADMVGGARMKTGNPMRNRSVSPQIQGLRSISRDRVRSQNIERGRGTVRDKAAAPQSAVEAFSKEMKEPEKQFFVNGVEIPASKKLKVNHKNQSGPPRGQSDYDVPKNAASIDKSFLKNGLVTFGKDNVRYRVKGIYAIRGCEYLALQQVDIEKPMPVGPGWSGIPVGNRPISAVDATNKIVYVCCGSKADMSTGRVKTVSTYEWTMFHNVQPQSGLDAFSEFLEEEESQGCSEEQQREFSERFLKRGKGGNKSRRNIQIRTSPEGEEFLINHEFDKDFRGTDVCFNGVVEEPFFVEKSVHWAGHIWEKAKKVLYHCIHDAFWLLYRTQKPTQERFDITLRGKCGITPLSSRPFTAVYVDRFDNIYIGIAILRQDLAKCGGCEIEPTTRALTFCSPPLSSDSEEEEELSEAEQEKRFFQQQLDTYNEWKNDPEMLAMVENFDCNFDMRLPAGVLQGTATETIEEEDDDDMAALAAGAANSERMADITGVDKSGSEDIGVDLLKVLVEQFEVLISAKNQGFPIGFRFRYQLLELSIGSLDFSKYKHGQAYAFTWKNILQISIDRTVWDGAITDDLLLRGGRDCTGLASDEATAWWNEAEDGLVHAMNNTWKSSEWSELTKPSAALLYLFLYGEDMYLNLCDHRVWPFGQELYQSIMDANKEEELPASSPVIEAVPFTGAVNKEDAFIVPVASEWRAVERVKGFLGKLDSLPGDPTFFDTAVGYFQISHGNNNTWGWAHKGMLVTAYHCTNGKDLLNKVGDAVYRHPMLRGDKKRDVAIYGRVPTEGLFSACAPSEICFVYDPYTDSRRWFKKTSVPLGMVGDKKGEEFFRTVFLPINNPRECKPLADERVNGHSGLPMQRMTDGAIVGLVSSAKPMSEDFIKKHKLFDFQAFPGQIAAGVADQMPDTPTVSFESDLNDICKAAMGSGNKEKHIIARLGSGKSSRLPYEAYKRLKNWKKDKENKAARILVLNPIRQSNLSLKEYIGMQSWYPEGVFNLCMGGDQVPQQRANEDMVLYMTYGKFVETFSTLNKIHWDIILLDEIHTYLTDSDVFAVYKSRKHLNGKVVAAMTATDIETCDSMECFPENLTNYQVDISVGEILQGTATVQPSMKAIFTHQGLKYCVPVGRWTELVEGKGVCLVYVWSRDMATSLSTAVGKTFKNIKTSYFHSTVDRAQFMQWLNANSDKFRMVFCTDSVENGVTIPDVTGIVHLGYTMKPVYRDGESLEDGRRYNFGCVMERKACLRASILQALGRAGRQQAGMFIHFQNDLCMYSKSIDYRDVVKNTEACALPAMIKMQSPDNPRPVCAETQFLEGMYVEQFAREFRTEAYKTVWKYSSVPMYYAIHNTYTATQLKYIMSQSVLAGYNTHEKLWTSMSSANKAVDDNHTYRVDHYADMRTTQKHSSKNVGGSGLSERDCDPEQFTSTGLAIGIVSTVAAVGLAYAAAEVNAYIKKNGCCLIEYFWFVESWQSVRDHVCPNFWEDPQLFNKQKHWLRKRMSGNKMDDCPDKYYISAMKTSENTAKYVIDKLGATLTFEQVPSAVDEWGSSESLQAVEENAAAGRYSWFSDKKEKVVNAFKGYWSKRKKSEAQCPEQKEDMQSIETDVFRCILAIGRAIGNETVADLDVRTWLIGTLGPAAALALGAVWGRLCDSFTSGGAAIIMFIMIIAISGTQTLTGLGLLLAGTMASYLAFAGLNRDRLRGEIKKAPGVSMLIAGGVGLWIKYITSLMPGAGMVVGLGLEAGFQYPKMMGGVNEAINVVNVSPTTASSEVTKSVFGQLNSALNWLGFDGWQERYLGAFAGSVGTGASIALNLLRFKEGNINSGSRAVESVTTTLLDVLAGGWQAAVVGIVTYSIYTFFRKLGKKVGKNESAVLGCITRNDTIYKDLKTYINERSTEEVIDYIATAVCVAFNPMRLLTGAVYTLVQYIMADEGFDLKSTVMRGASLSPLVAIFSLIVVGGKKIYDRTVNHDMGIEEQMCSPSDTMGVAWATMKSALPKGMHIILDSLKRFGTMVYEMNSWIWNHLWDKMKNWGLMLVKNVQCHLTQKAISLISWATMDEMMMCQSTMWIWLLVFGAGYGTASICNTIVNWWRGKRPVVCLGDAPYDGTIKTLQSIETPKTESEGVFLVETNRLPVLRTGEQTISEGVHAVFLPRSILVTASGRILGRKNTTYQVAAKRGGIYIYKGSDLVLWWTEKVLPHGVTEILYRMSDTTDFRMAALWRYMGADHAVSLESSRGQNVNGVLSAESMSWFGNNVVRNQQCGIYNHLDGSMMVIMESTEFSRRHDAITCAGEILHKTFTGDGYVLFGDRRNWPGVIVGEDPAEYKHWKNPYWPVGMNSFGYVTPDGQKLLGAKYSNELLEKTDQQIQDLRFEKITKAHLEGRVIPQHLEALEKESYFNRDLSSVKMSGIKSFCSETGRWEVQITVDWTEKGKQHSSAIKKHGVFADSDCLLMLETAPPVINSASTPEEVKKSVVLATLRESVIADETSIAGRRRKFTALWAPKTGITLDARPGLEEVKKSCRDTYYSLKKGTKKILQDVKNNVEEKAKKAVKVRDGTSKHVDLRAEVDNVITARDEAEKSLSEDNPEHICAALKWDKFLTEVREPRSVEESEKSAMFLHLLLMDAVSESMPKIKAAYQVWGVSGIMRQRLVQYLCFLLPQVYPNSVQKKCVDIHFYLFPRGIRVHATSERRCWGYDVPFDTWIPEPKYEHLDIPRQVRSNKQAGGIYITEDSVYYDVHIGYKMTTEGNIDFDKWEDEIAKHDSPKFETRNIIERARVNRIVQIAEGKVLIRKPPEKKASFATKVWNRLRGNVSLRGSEDHMNPQSREEIRPLLSTSDSEDELFNLGIARNSHDLKMEKIPGEPTGNNMWETVYDKEKEKTSSKMKSSSAIPEEERPLLQSSGDEEEVACSGNGIYTFGKDKRAYVVEQAQEIGPHYDLNRLAPWLIHCRPVTASGMEKVSWYDPSKAGSVDNSVVHPDDVLAVRRGLLALSRQEFLANARAGTYQVPKKGKELSVGYFKMRQFLEDFPNLDYKRVWDATAGSGGFVQAMNEVQKGSLIVASTKRDVVPALSPEELENRGNAVQVFTESTSMDSVSNTQFQEQFRKAYPEGFTFAVWDAGESMNNPLKENFWLLNNNRLEALHFMTTMISPGGSMMIKLKGLWYTSVFIEQLCKQFGRACAWFCPTRRTNSQEWYLVLNRKKADTGEERQGNWRAFSRSVQKGLLRTMWDGLNQTMSGMDSLGIYRPLPIPSITTDKAIVEAIDGVTFRKGKQGYKGWSDVQWKGTRLKSSGQKAWEWISQHHKMRGRILPTGDGLKHQVKVCSLKPNRKGGADKVHYNPTIKKYVTAATSWNVGSSTIGIASRQPSVIKEAIESRLDQPIHPIKESDLELLDKAFAYLLRNVPDESIGPLEYSKTFKQVNRKGALGFLDDPKLGKNLGEYFDNPLVKEDVCRKVEQWQVGDAGLSYVTIMEKYEKKDRKCLEDGFLTYEGESAKDRISERDTFQTKHWINRTSGDTWRERNKQLFEKHFFLPPRLIRYLDAKTRLAENVLYGVLNELYQSHALFEQSFAGETWTSVGERIYREFDEMEALHGAGNVGILEGDFSKYDHHQNKQDYAVECHNIKKKFKREWQKAVETNYSIKSEVVQIADFGVYVTNGQRLSGEKMTSAGNTIKGGAYLLACISKVTGLTFEQILRNFRLGNNGDDWFLFGEKKLMQRLAKVLHKAMRNYGHELRAGTKEGVLYHDDIANLSFCSHRYVRNGRFICPWRSLSTILGKLTLSCKVAGYKGDHAEHNLVTASTALSYLLMYPASIIVRHVCLAVLAETGLPDGIFDSIKRKMMYKMGRWDHDTLIGALSSVWGVNELGEIPFLSVDIEGREIDYLSRNILFASRRVKHQIRKNVSTSIASILMKYDHNIRIVAMCPRLYAHYCIVENRKKPRESMLLRLFE